MCSPKVQEAFLTINLREGEEVKETIFIYVPCEGGEG